MSNHENPTTFEVVPDEDVEIIDDSFTTVLCPGCGFCATNGGHAIDVPLVYGVSHGEIVDVLCGEWSSPEQVALAIMDLFR